jgi:hypothetical protein
MGAFISDTAPESVAALLRAVAGSETSAAVAGDGALPERPSP